MMLSAELELAGLIYALYLQDAVVLLHSNEGVLTRTGQGHWALGLGASNWRIRGKNLYWPLPFTVHRPHYRLRWDFEASPTNPAAASPPRWAPKLEAFKGLGWFTALSVVLQLLVFPVVMFAYPTNVAVIATLVAIYACVLASLGVVWRGASTWGYSGRKLAGLCFECLVCPPLAINLVHRLSLDLCKTADLLATAETLLPPDAWLAARKNLCVRLEDQMSLEPDDSPRLRALQARHAALLPPRSPDDDEQ